MDDRTQVPADMITNAVSTGVDCITVALIHLEDLTEERMETLRKTLKSTWFSRVRRSSVAGSTSIRRQTRQ